MVEEVVEYPDQWVYFLYVGFGTKIVVFGNVRFKKSLVEIFAKLLVEESVFLLGHGDELAGNFTDQVACSFQQGVVNLQLSEVNDKEGFFFDELRKL